MRQTVYVLLLHEEQFFRFMNNEVIINNYWLIDGLIKFI